VWRADTSVEDRVLRFSPLRHYLDFPPTATSEMSDCPTSFASCSALHESRFIISLHLPLQAFYCLEIAYTKLHVVVLI
jgi:hypothetical protein